MAGLCDAQRLRHSGGVPHNLPEQALIGKGGLANQHVVEHAANAVNVGADIAAARIARLLRHQVVRCAKQHALRGQVESAARSARTFRRRFFKELACQPNVQDLDAIIRRLRFGVGN